MVTLEIDLPEPTISEKNGGIEVTILTGNQAGNEVSNQVGNFITAFPALLQRLNSLLKEYQYKPSEKNIEKFSNEAQRITDQEYKIISFCQQPKKRKEILEDCLGLSNQTKNYNTNIEPLVKKGLIKFTFKDRPNSQFQRYITSPKGKVIVYLYEQLNHGNTEKEK